MTDPVVAALRDVAFALMRDMTPEQFLDLLKIQAAEAREHNGDHTPESMVLDECIRRLRGMP